MIYRISSWVNSPPSRFFSIKKLNVGLMKRRVGMFRLLVIWNDKVRATGRRRRAEKFVSQSDLVKKSSSKPDLFYSPFSTQVIAGLHPTRHLLSVWRLRRPKRQRQPVPALSYGSHFPR